MTRSALRQFALGMGPETNGHASVPSPARPPAGATASVRSSEASPGPPLEIGEPGSPTDHPAALASYASVAAYLAATVDADTLAQIRTDARARAINLRAQADAADGEALTLGRALELLAEASA